MKYTVTLLLFCCCVGIFAQNNKKADSLYNVMQTSRVDTTRIQATIALARIVRKTNPDSGLVILEKVSRECEQKKLYELFFSSENTRAWIYHHKENFDESDRIYKSILASKHLTPTAEMDCYSSMSHINTISRKFNLSLKYALKVIKLANKYNKPTYLTSAYTSLGNLYSAWSNEGRDSTLTWKSMLYYEKSDSVAKVYNMTEYRQKITMANLAMAYGSCKLYEKAERTYREVFQYLGNSINHSGYAMALGNYADMMNLRFEESKNKSYLVTSVSYATRSYEEAVIAGYTGIMANILITRARAYAGLKNWRAVEEDAQHILKDHANSASPHFISEAWKLLYLAAEAKGQYAKALEYHKKYTELKDSSAKEENIRGLHELQTQFDTEKKDEQIKQLHKDKKKDAALQKANEARSRIILYSVLGGLFIVVLFSFFLYNRFRISQRQKKEIEHQKELVEEKQKEIIDSINYAKRLQDAILPSENAWNKTFPQSFIFYKPKDIVAGDFYFLERLDNTVIVAVADCTGHGVPGAMVSVVCANALTRSVREFKLTDPGKILDKTRELVLETFSASEKEVKDGMDIALCSLKFDVSGSKLTHEQPQTSNYKPQTNAEIKFSGANNPLWYIENGELKEIKGDKQPIGFTDNPKPFTTHTITNLESQIPSLFLFTDGYADQFGGDKGKKLKTSALQKILAQHSVLPMEQQRNHLSSFFENWRHGLEQIDDVCIIGIRL